ncbi:protein shortage in chiasmata 1 ortholog [Sardina pilchardus]|uniref:protein shortage in chiasmata 1 ortholog n=1 Tax=Sardina pilchardus TaxID=27697 RepID=UPI002E12EB0D
MSAPHTLSEAEALDIVPSSNPASQACPEAEEIFWQVTHKKSETDVSLVDDFTKAAGSDMSVGHEELLLEELLASSPLPQFKKHMPTLRVKLSRLKAVLVLDPLQTPMGGSLSEDMIFGRCVPYDISSCGDTNSSQMRSSDTEEFSKVSPRDEESLMLLEVESCSMHKESFNTSLAHLSSILQVREEPVGDQVSSVDMLKKVTPADLQEMHHFRTLDAPSNSLDTLNPLDPKSPVPLRLYPELELDVPFFPVPGPQRPELRLPNSHLQPEPLPPIYRHWLVSDEEREESEQVLWSSEKQHNAIGGFLLAEPSSLERFEKNQPLTDALKLLGISAPKQEVGLTGLPEQLQSLVKGCVEFPEDMTAEPLSIEKRDLVKPEDFTVLSGSEIDAKPTQPPATSVQGDLKRQAVPSQQEDGAAVKKLIMERMAWPAEISTPAWEHAPSIKTQERVANFAPASHPPKELPSRTSEHKPVTHSDLLSSFMMLRQQQRVLESSEKTSSTLTGAAGDKNVQVKRFTNQRPTEQRPGEGSRPLVTGTASSSGPPERGSSSAVQGTHSITASTGQASRASTPVGQTDRASTPIASDSRDGKAEAQVPAERDNKNCRVIPVQATESQLLALRAVQAVGEPCFSRALELGLSATGGCRDFSSLDTERSLFLLKQQQKQLSVMPGLEQLYVEVALLHTLATVKELVLQCGVGRACDYLAKAKTAHETDALEHLHKKYLIWQFHSQKNLEPDPKLLELQDVMRSWLQSVATQQPLSKVLLLISSNSDSVRTLLIGSLSEISGEGVVDAVVSEENCWQVDGKKVLNSLRRSSWVVVCSLHLGPDFPWHAFSVVVEYDSLGHTPWPSICSERSISYVTFATVTPASDTTAPPSPSTDLERIPFTLFVTEGLLDRSSLLQTLESVYNLTMIERSQSPSLKMLGGAHQYAVITVDESTAVLLQEVDELATERASERVVMRLIALSLQYSSCWFLLHLPSARYSCVSVQILTNLALIYSAVVLFGLKSEEFSVKVLVVSEEEDIARWIYQIAHHSMMSSEGDPQRYLDREWLSVLPSQDEDSLMRFPSVNPLVAQIMLKRAPSLRWLLGASLTELQQLLPEVPHKVIKLFTDTTGLYPLGSPAPQPNPVPDPEPQPQPQLPQMGRTSAQDPWASAVQPQASHYSHSPQEEALFHKTSSAGQSDARFHKKEEWGRAGNSTAGLSDAFFQKTSSAGQNSALFHKTSSAGSSAGQNDVLFHKTSSAGQNDVLFHKTSSAASSAGQSDALFHKTSSAGQSDALFHKKEEWRHTGNSTAGQSHAFSHSTQDWGQEGNSCTGQNDAIFHRKKDWGHSGAGQTNAAFHRNEDWEQTRNPTAGQTDAYFHRNEDWGQARSSSEVQTGAYFHNKEDWEQKEAGQADAFFHRTQDWGQTGNSTARQSDVFSHKTQHWGKTGNSDQTDAFFQWKNDWGQTMNASAGQRDDVFRKTDDWEQPGYSDASQADPFFQRKGDFGQRETAKTEGVFRRRDDWGITENSCAVPSNDAFRIEVDWGQTESPFSPTPAATATPPMPQGFQRKHWHMGVKEDKFIPRTNQARDWTPRISPKDTAYYSIRETQTTSPFERSFSSGPQPSPYFQSQMPAAIPCGPAHSIASSPVSRWTGRLISEAYRFTPGGGSSRPAGMRDEQDRKRRAELSPASGYPDTKKAKLLYEKVPGRSDGQTRLRVLGRLIFTSQRTTASPSLE